MTITIIIIVITAALSIYAFQKREVYFRLLFNAYQIKHNQQIWRFFSYALVHANWGHLLINMFVLYSFGGQVERTFMAIFGSTKGSFYFILLYVFGILFATIWDYWKHQDDVYYNAVGASGAVNAVLFSSILMSPTSRLIIFPIPIPIPAFIFGVLYVAYSVIMARRGKDNVGHSAHLWGAAFGLLFTFALMPQEIIAFYQSLF